MVDRLTERLPVVTHRLDVFLANPPESKPDWIPGMLPRQGGKMLLGGLPKIGKSILLLELSRALISGGMPFGRQDLTCGKAKVLYLGAEAKLKEMFERGSKIFRSSSLDEQRNFTFVIGDPRLMLDSADGVHMIEDTIQEIQPNIVIFDPMQNFIQGDENSSSELGRVFHNVDYLLYAFRHIDLSCIMAHHFRKSGSKDEHDPLDPENFRGSGRWFGWVDSAMMCHRHKDNVLPTHRWWIDKVRWRSRHAGDLPDFAIHINEADTLEALTGREPTLLRNPFKQ